MTPTPFPNHQTYPTLTTNNKFSYKENIPTLIKNNNKTVTSDMVVAWPFQHRCMSKLHAMQITNFQSQVRHFRRAKKVRIYVKICSKRAHFCNFLRISAHFWTFGLLVLSIYGFWTYKNFKEKSWKLNVQFDGEKDWCGVRIGKEQRSYDCCRSSLGRVFHLRCIHQYWLGSSRTNCSIAFVYSVVIHSSGSSLSAHSSGKMILFAPISKKKRFSILLL